MEWLIQLNFIQMELVLQVEVQIKLLKFGILEVQD